MYAVIETGGKQYRVEVGNELEVELLEAEPGQAITIERVLLVADGPDTAVGQPLVAGAAVSAQVVRQARGDKVIAFKYRPKARRRVKKGHRQELTILRVTDIRLGSRSAAEESRRAEEAAKTERQRLEEAAARQAAEDAALAAKLAAKTAKAEAAKAEEAPAKPKTARAGKAKAPTEAAEKPKRARAKASPAESAEGETPAKDAPEETPTAAPKRTRTKKDE